MAVGYALKALSVSSYILTVSADTERMNSVSVGSRNLAAYSYGAANSPLTELLYANGTSLSQEYDQLERVSDVYYNDDVQNPAVSYPYSSTGQGILGSNMFAYCLNNPVNTADPDGTITLQATLPMFAEFAPLLSGAASPTPPGNGDRNNRNSGDQERGNWQNVKEKYLEKQLRKQGINPHDVKYEYLGKRAEIKRYDIYMDNGTGRLAIFEKSTGRSVEVTHYFIK